jgi:hypothetical protein
MSVPSTAHNRVLVRTALVLAPVLACTALIVPSPGAELTRVTVITDFVGAALLWDPGPLHDFSAGLDVRGYAFGCRKLVTPGCPQAAGVNPPSALDIIQQLGPAMGPIVVIDVGYNDTADGYSAGLDEVMRALLAHDVQRVVWVTLEEGESSWLSIDDQIRAAPARWPQLVVADWGPTVTGKTWLLNDVVHLNHDGAVALGQFLRPIVLSQLQLIKDTTPPDLRLPASVHTRTTSRHGRVLSFRPVALDAIDGEIPETCTPASPHRYPIGKTNVTCRATDKAGNRAVGNFAVYVTKTSPRPQRKIERQAGAVRSGHSS